MLLAISLEEARLCLDCDTIHVYMTCPKCGSRQWVWLRDLLPLMRDEEECHG